MNEQANTILAWLLGIPDWLLYFIIGGAAAIENLIPPFPGDVVVVVGGVIAGAGGAEPGLLFLVVWLANVASALAVYALGRRYGASFFAGPVGRFLLAPRQVESLGMAYRRFGVAIIFLSRFLPVFRPIVPVFAGVARLGFFRTALPILLASALWYGFLVYLGAFAGANLNAVLDLLGRIGGWMWMVAGVAIAGILWWWWRTRHAEHLDRGQDGSGE